MTDSLTAAPPKLGFGLRWGIKQSFVAYVRRMPDGSGWVGDGALPLESDEVLYAPERAEWGPTAEGGFQRSWTFRGDVRFSGHAGMLFVRVASPVLTVLDGAAELTVVDPSGEPDSDRLQLVTLRLDPLPAPEGIELWRGTDVRLTEAGTGLFNDVYPRGEPFEPLTVVLPATDGPA